MSAGSSVGSSGSGHFEVCKRCGAPVGSVPVEGQNPYNTTLLCAFWCFRCQDAVETETVARSRWMWVGGQVEKGIVSRPCEVCGGDGKPPLELREANLPCICSGYGSLILKEVELG